MCRGDAVGDPASMARPSVSHGDRFHYRIPHIGTNYLHYEELVIEWAGIGTGAVCPKHCRWAALDDGNSCASAWMNDIGYAITNRNMF